MSQQYFDFGDTGETAKTVIDDNFIELYGLVESKVIIQGKVTYFADLPTVADHTNEFWLVTTASGSVITFNRKAAGLYQSDGTTWSYTGINMSYRLTDSNFILSDDGDSTKRARFEVSNIDTETTRVYNTPNQDGTLALTEDLDDYYTQTEVDALLSAKSGVFAYLVTPASTTITTSGEYEYINGTFTNNPIEEFEVVYNTGSITVFADASNGVTTVTSISHGLSSGDRIDISGTTNYNGSYTVLNITTDTFDIEETFITNDATGTWLFGPGIRYTGTTTKYFGITFHATVEADSNGTTITMSTKNNGTVCSCAQMDVYCKTANEKFHISGTSVVELSTGDDIQLVVTSDGSGDVITIDDYQTKISQFF